MKHSVRFILVVGLVLSLNQLALASYKGKGAKSSSYGGSSGSYQQSTPKATTRSSKKKMVSDDDIIQAVRSHIIGNLSYGTMNVTNSATGQARSLASRKVHKTVHSLSGNKYYLHADFTDTNTDDVIDVDIVVQNRNGQLTVTHMYVHKINDRELFAYRNGQRVSTSRMKVAMYNLGGASARMGSGY